jgi:GT2 family glycosyltransferase
MNLQSPVAPGLDINGPRRPAVAVILVNWNGWQHAIECLDSLLVQDYPNFHVFLVDNDSHDDSVKQIACWCAAPQRLDHWRGFEGVLRWTERHPGKSIVCDIVDSVPSSDCGPFAPGAVTIIRSGGNLGFAGGCNVAIRIAVTRDFAFFWLLNTDTVLHREALDALVLRALSDHGIGMVGSTIRFYDRPEVVQCLGGARMNPATMDPRLIGTGASVASIPRDPSIVERELVYVMGASMLVSAAFVRDVGLLQEDYFLYGEEIDWAMRARNRFRLAYAPASHVFHKSGATSSKVLPLFTAKYYYRNRIRIIDRFFPEHLGAAKRGLALELIRLLLKGRWRHMGIVASTLWNARKLTPETPPPRLTS